jgi:hypothetical protein
MRASGKHTLAEMAERLVLRGLGKLGIRQGAAKPDPLRAIQEHVDRQRAAASEGRS